MTPNNNKIIFKSIKQKIFFLFYFLFLCSCGNSKFELASGPSNPSPVFSEVDIIFEQKIITPNGWEVKAVQSNFSGVVLSNQWEILGE